MKHIAKISLAFFLVIASLGANAQIQEGTNFIQGSANIEQSFGQKTPQNYSGSINWGKYISKNSARIWSFSVNYTDSNLPSTGLSKNKSLSFGLGKGQEFYKNIFGKFGLYGRILGSVNYTKSDIANITSNDPFLFTDKTNNQISLNLTGGAGLIYTLNDKWAFTGQLLNLNVASLGYSWENGSVSPNQGPVQTYTQRQFNYNFNPNISLSYGVGIRYMFK